VVGAGGGSGAASVRAATGSSAGARISAQVRPWSQRNSPAAAAALARSLLALLPSIPRMEDKRFRSAVVSVVFISMRVLPIGSRPNPIRTTLTDD
jgi:hypothetical protein